MALRYLAFAALIGCARPQLFGAPIPRGCTKDVKPDNDRCVGWFLDRILTATTVEYDDHTIRDYVASVGAKLVRASGDRREWRFRVLDDSSVRAYSSLATTVYVSRGALARLRSEAELAAVLGHEIAHVLAGHAHENVAQLARTTVPEDLIADRDDEIQADELAVRLASLAGYDANASETMLRALAAGDTDDPTDHHPPMPVRIARVQAFAAHFPGGTRGEAAFRTHVADLAVDDEAHVIDHAIVFARARLALELPPTRRIEIHDGHGRVELATGTQLDVRRVSPDLAREMPARQDDAYLIRHVRGHTALVVSIEGANAAALSRTLTIRAPTAAELALVHPQRIDFTAPRMLWPGTK